MTADPESCPLCASRRSEPLWRDPVMEMYRCGNCGLRWSPTAGADGEDPYGEEYYRNNYLPRRRELLRFFADRIDGLTRRLGRRGRVLDVGCGVGAFLEAAVDGGWEAHGIDPSAAACALAHETLRGRATVRRVRLEDALLDPASFDAVTFWDVLAHLREPRAALLEARRLLRDDGVLVVKTPVRSGEVFEALARLPRRFAALRRSLVHFPMQLCHFSERGLSATFDELGFTSVVCRVDAEPAPISVPLPRVLHRPRGFAYGLAHRLSERLHPRRSAIIEARPRPAARLVEVAARAQ